MYIVLKMFALFFKELHFNWTYFFALPHEFCLFCHTNFSLYFFIRISLCSIRTFTMVISYEFSVYFSPLFLCSFRPYFIRIFSSLYTNRLPYILHCFAFVYEFWNAVPLKQWIWLCYLYYSNFYAIHILQCLWLSSFLPFHWLVLSL